MIWRLIYELVIRYQIGGESIIGYVQEKTWSLLIGAKYDGNEIKIMYRFKTLFICVYWFSHGTPSSSGHPSEHESKSNFSNNKNADFSRDLVRWNLKRVQQNKYISDGRRRGQIGLHPIRKPVSPHRIDSDWTWNSIVAACSDRCATAAWFPLFTVLALDYW